MSGMVHYIIINETVLVEQYANDRGGLGRGSETLSSFSMFNGSRKFACFLIFGDAQNHIYLQSV